MLAFKRTLVALMFAAASVGSAAQAPQVFPPLDVRAAVSPRPFAAELRTHLVYELHITNMSRQAVRLDSVEIRDRSASREAPPLARLDDRTLESALLSLGSAPTATGDRRLLPPGRAAVLFLWITMQAGTAPPAALTHRFNVRLADSAGPSIAVDGVDVLVPTMAPRVLGPPLEGDLWLAANGPGNDVGHRRTLMALTGEARIAQRFATDWVRLFENGRTLRGDPRQNSSYRAYGANVLAVADGTVLEIVDGIPENVPDPVARAVRITPATLGGNYILLDLGNGASATYAHLQPGSIRVKQGERVRRGQVLGLVGNTGNSTEPHLHFHVADRRSAFDAEGLPFALSAFDLQADGERVTQATAEVDNSVGVDPVRLKTWLGAAPQRRHNEMPLSNAIVNFDPAR